MGHLHNSQFPSHVSGNMYEYRGVGIFEEKHGYRIDFATGDIYTSTLEKAKRIIDKKLNN